MNITETIVNLKELQKLNTLCNFLEEKETKSIESAIEHLELITSHTPEGRNYTNKQYIDLLLENEKLKLQVGELLEDNTHLRLVCKIDENGGESN